MSQGSYMGVPACPDCHGPMVKLNGVHGEFWGCVIYPQCRGSRSLDLKATRSDGRTKDWESGYWSIVSDFEE